MATVLMDINITCFSKVEKCTKIFLHRKTFVCFSIPAVNVFCLNNLLKC